MPKSAEKPSKTQQAVSLQQQLIKTTVFSSVVAGLIAFILLLSISIYQTMSLQDDMMEEIAEMLLTSDLTRHSGAQLDELSEQFDIQYQLKYNRQLLTQSDRYNLPVNSQILMFWEHQHFALAWVNGTVYRVYHTEDDGQSLSLYQPLKVRFDDVFESVFGFVGILIILWILQWVLVHFAVKKLFKSVLQLSREISEKTAQDLTPIHTTQPQIKELRPIVNQLNQMLGRVEQSLLAEQRFTSDASHELRSPLSAIQMRLQLLKRKYQDATISQDLEQIQADVTRGVNVLENLLLLARLDPSQKENLPRTIFDLKQIVLEVQSALKLFALEKNITVNIQAVSVQCNANQELIFSCIRNLVDNAIRYSPLNGHIEIVLGQQDSNAILTISNTGDYISDVVLHRMGERFYRELGSRTQGSGLGLSICKKIVVLHQGHIVFENPQKGGLIVKLSMPILNVNR